MATVVLPRSLLSLIPAAPRRCDVEATTVAEAIDGLEAVAPGICNRLLDAGPTIRTHINIFVDGTPATLTTLVQPESTVHVIPAVSGG